MKFILDLDDETVDRLKEVGNGHSAGSLGDEILGMALIEAFKKSKELFLSNTVSLRCLPDTVHNLPRPNEFYSLEAGKEYLSRPENFSELEGERFVYLLTSAGMWNVRLARFEILQETKEN